MKKIKTIFFGTHNFAATILQGLIDSDFIDVGLVITQPDKPVGRKKIMTPSPVKILAEKHGLKVDQPESLKNYELRTPNSELGITAQYGLLIPEHILKTPKHGTLNIHTSLLPKYRGASPIQSALINGEKQTGVTIMKMDAGLDTGPILLQKTLQINADDTYLDLDKKLAKIGISAVLEGVPDYIQGNLKPQKQNEKQATTCQQFTRDDGQVDWSKTAQQIYNKYRGLTPWPGIWTTLDNKRLKLLKIKPSDKNVGCGMINIEKNKIYVGCKNKSIEILELQLEGKQKMSTEQFINGFKNIINNNKLLSY